MEKITWSPFAISDLKEIHDYIAKDSLRYAEGMVEGIIERIENLNRFPLMGRMVPEFYDEMVRELIYKGYRILYELKTEGKIEILSIIHGSRLL